MRAVRLEDAHDEQEFGGKAVQLGAAIRAGLPVPDGYALHADLVAALAGGDGEARSLLAGACDRLGGALAVRSSAVGEDSAAASFAGQHTTVLNVAGVEAALRAVGDVWNSAWSDSALAYRRRVGAGAAVRVGVVVQRLIAADVAGVLFTRNPVTGGDELVIESSWGLGEAVVQGMVIPDRYRVALTGEVLMRAAGSKQIAVRLCPDGETIRRPVDAALVGEHSLDDAKLGALTELASRCADAFGRGPHDLEWAFDADRLFLLQRRSVTAAAAAGPA